MTRGAAGLDALATGDVLARRLVTLAHRGHLTPCRSDPDTWFAEDPAEQADAIEACSYCPALAPCRTYADVNGERYGVWGGRLRSDRAIRQAVA